MEIPIHSLTSDYLPYSKKNETKRPTDSIHKKIEFEILNKKR